MRPIVIKEENRKRIEDYLAEVQARAQVRCVGYDHIVRACEAIETRLGIPKKYLEGLEYDLDPCARNFPNAYKGIPESTHVVIRRHNNAWQVVSARRGMVRTYGHNCVCTNMPEETEDAIIRARMDHSDTPLKEARYRCRRNIVPRGIVPRRVVPVESDTRLFRPTVWAYLLDPLTLSLAGLAVTLALWRTGIL